MRYRFDSSNPTQRDNGRTGLTWPHVFLIAGLPALLTLCGLSLVMLTRPAAVPAPAPAPAAARSVSNAWSGASLVVQCQGFEPGDTALFFLTPSMDRAFIERKPVTALTVSPQGTCDSGPLRVDAEIAAASGWQLVAQSARANTLVNAAFAAAPASVAQASVAEATVPAPAQLVASIGEPAPAQQPTPGPATFPTDVPYVANKVPCSSQTPLPNDMWCVEYFLDRDQDADPVYAELILPASADEMILWRGVNWPSQYAGSMPESNFRIVFSGNFNFPGTHSYLITMRLQGSARIKIGDRPEIDAYSVGSKKPSTYRVAINSGYHPVRLEYYLDGGQPSIYLKWKPDVNRNDYWMGRYYNNIDMNAPVTMIRQDESIDFAWDGSPGGNVPADNFSVQWLRVFQVPRNGMTCSMTADDRVRVYVDGRLIPELSNWDNPNVWNRTVTLNAGRRFVEVHFVEQGGLAVIRFNCTSTAPAY